MVFNQKLADIIDPIIDAKTNDWRQLAMQAGDLSPKDLFESAESFSDAEERAGLRGLLRNYKTEIINHINHNINQSSDYIDLEKQFEIYWNCPVFPRGSLNY